MEQQFSEGQLQVIASIVDAFATTAPTIPSAIVERALTDVVPHGKARTRIAKQLREDPGVLTRGDSLALPQLNYLIRHLRDLGYTGVEIPRCSRCDRPQRLPHRDGRGGRECNKCNKARVTPPCTRCARVVASGYRILDTKPYCMACWRRDPRTFVDCTQCGERRPSGRSRTGPALCERCYAPTAEDL